VNTPAAASEAMHGVAASVARSRRNRDANRGWRVRRPRPTRAPARSTPEACDRPVLVSVENSCPDCPHAQIEVTARIDTIEPWIKQAVTRTW